MWVIQCYREQLQAFLSWMIEAQVQFSQVGGVGIQSKSQKRTTFLCDLTA